MNIILITQGDQFSNKFLQSWTRLIKYLIQKGHNVMNIFVQGSNIHHVREISVSGVPFGNTEEVKLFSGLEYDYVLWIDSDQLFEPVHFEMLFEDDVDVVSAAIKMLPSYEYSVTFLEKKKHVKYKDLSDKPRLMEVEKVGFGFLLVKHGVFERMTFPYFAPEKVKNGMLGSWGEDFSWCTKAKKAGIKLHVDTKCRVLHEKVFCI